jgi:subtilisin-like proprotein convertase family protein
MAVGIVDQGLARRSSHLRTVLGPPLAATHGGGYAPPRHRLVTATSRRNIRGVSLVALVAAMALLAAPGAAAAKTKTKTFSSGTINLPVPDPSGTVVGKVVPGINADKKNMGKLKDVNVAVRISHPFDADVGLILIPPTDGVLVLSNFLGGTGDNYGSGSADCDGVFTVFDDSATTPISAGAPPFNGSFRPQEPLATASGSRSRGLWRLVVSDVAAGDMGTLHCWEITMTYKVKKKLKS